ncbi:MAG: glycosyl transferase, group 1 family protein [Firmicutes bacterium]|nr:glycosyl transferase, group 1 family protein [Bacillota bacterium]
MKVLHIITGNDDGGGAKHILNLCLNSEGKMKCTIGCIGGGALYEKAVENNIECILLSPKSFLGSEAADCIAEKCFDIVNFHGAKAFFLGKFLLNKLSIPAVATVHSNYRQDFLNSRMKHLLFTPLSISGLRSFGYFICVSNYIKNLLNVDGIGGRKFVIPNGINLDECRVASDASAVRSSLGIGEGDFVFTMVARFHPVKNHITLIKAFSRLRAEFDNVKLVLIGEGSHRAEIEAASGAGVIFAGFRENVLDYINASDITVLTSLSEGGAPPLVVLESAAVSKTVIASSVSDMPHIINGGNGFLVDPYSEEDIYLKLREAYLHPGTIKAMGENLNRYVREKYSIDRFCSNYFEAYKAIVEDSKVVKP